jgi:hypothetical protein
MIRLAGACCSWVALVSPKPASRLSTKGALLRVGPGVLPLATRRSSRPCADREPLRSRRVSQPSRSACHCEESAQRAPRQSIKTFDMDRDGVLCTPRDDNRGRIGTLCVFIAGTTSVSSAKEGVCP